MSNLRTGMRRRGNHIKNGIAKRSPEILTAGAMITSAAALGTAIKATVNIREEWEALNEEIETIKANFDRKNEIYDIETDTEIIEYEGHDAIDVYRSDLAKAYGKRALLVGKHYGLSAALELASLGSMFGSNKISRKRNATLGAALGASQMAYDSLKKNLVAAVGEEEADLIEMGLKKEKVTKKVKDENGKTKKVTEEVIVPVDNDGYVTNPWVIKITPDMKGIWQHDWRNMVDVLGLKRNYWEQIMITRAPEDRGVFFNEIVEDMGIEGRKEGQIFGYKYNKYDDNPDTIDFGIKVVEASPEDKIKYNVCKMVYLNFRPRRIIDECYRGFVDDAATARNQWNQPGDFTDKGINPHTF